MTDDEMCLSELLWHMENDRLLRQRISEAQLWRTAPDFDMSQLPVINAAIRDRLKLWGTDLDKEYAVEPVSNTKPRKGDWVEFSPTKVGVIQYIVYDNGPESVAVKLLGSLRFIDYSDFHTHSSKGGKTRWIMENSG